MWCDCDECGAFAWQPVTPAYVERDFIDDLPADFREMLWSGTAQAWRCSSCRAWSFQIWSPPVFVGKAPGGAAAAGSAARSRRGKK